MLEQLELDRLKDAARNALESYLDRLTLPSLLDYGSTRPLELTLSAALQTSGPTPRQTLELTVSPLQTRKVTNLLTSGTTPEEPSELKDCFSPEDLTRIPFLS